MESPLASLEPGLACRKSLSITRRHSERGGPRPGVTRPAPASTRPVHTSGAPRRPYFSLLTGSRTLPRMTLGEEAFLLIMGAVIGFGSSFAQSIFTSKQLKNERREERIAELNRELATALATARAVLADAYPGSLTDHDSSGLSHQGLQDNKDKWQPARVALLIASDRHPDDEVRRLTHRLTVAVDGMLTKCGNMIGAVGAR